MTEPVGGMLQTTKPKLVCLCPRLLPVGPLSSFRPMPLRHLSPALVSGVLVVPGNWTSSRYKDPTGSASVHKMTR